VSPRASPVHFASCNASDADLWPLLAPDRAIFLTFAEAFDALPLNLYQNFRAAPRLRRMQNAMVKVMDPPAALDDDDIVGDEGQIVIFRFDDDGEEAASLTERIKALIDDGIEPSEIAILVSKQQALYCQRLTAAFEAAEIPFREEDQAQDLASEPVARLVIDFLLIASATRQSAAYGRLLDFVVFNHGHDEEREYQLRSRWNRFVTETRRQVAEGDVDLADLVDLQTLVAALVDAVGRDNLIALSSDYAHGGRLDQLIGHVLERVHLLLQNNADSATALASFSGDNAVRIMSVHKSKGLEFDTVVILGVEEETFWSDAATERAAYFVGISRAKMRLWLTACQSRERPVGAQRWTVKRHQHHEFLGYAA